MAVSGFVGQRVETNRGQQEPAASPALFRAVPQALLAQNLLCTALPSPNSAGCVVTLLR